jgi:hypothetical protein
MSLIATTRSNNKMTLPTALNVTGRAPFMTSGSVRLPTVKVAARYGVVPRTIERWQENPALNFPKPLVVNGRKYWAVEVLERWERDQSAEEEAE